MTGYDPDRLHREIAFLTYHFHWSYHSVLSLEHRERQRWCSEINRINDESNRAASEPPRRHLTA